MDLTAASPKSACYMDETRETELTDISHVSASFSVPKISGTTNSIAGAIDKELAVNLHGSVPTGISFNHSQPYFNQNFNSTSRPVIVKPLHSDEPLQLDPSLLHSNEENEKEEKSAYEIAAEALCLMKHSGDHVQSGISPLNSTDYISTPSDDFDSSIDLSVESEVVIDSGPDLGVAYENEVEVAIRNTDSPSLNNDNASKKVVKYVLVPESAILSAEGGSASVSKMGMPLLYMVPQGDGTQQKVYKLTRPQQQPRVIKLKKKVQPASGEAILSHDDQSSYLPRSDMEQLNSFSMESYQDPRTKDRSLESTIDAITMETNSKSIRGKRHLSKKHDTLKFPPCVICTGEASGLHYGCNTCEACKNFFRRCLLRKTSSPFICHSGNNCEISFTKNKNNCSACRLNKCLEAGMAKEKCKMGRYTALMRTETIKKVRKLEGKDADSQHVISDMNTPLPSTSHHESISEKTDEDLCADMIPIEFLTEKGDASPQTVTEFNSDLVAHLVSAMQEIKPYGEELTTPELRKSVCKKHYENYKAKEAIFGSMTDISMSEYHLLLKKFGIDIDGSWESFKNLSPHWDVVIKKYCTFMKNVPNFSCLGYDDQATLLKATHNDFFSILCQGGYYPEYEVYLEVNGHPFHINETGNRFVTKELMLACCDIDYQLQKMNLLDFEVALLISIVSMSPDRCKLKNPDLVETTQLCLTNLLIQQLRKTYGHVKGRQRFTAFIDMLIKIREISHHGMKEYRTICNDEMVKQEIPDVDVLLPEED